MFFGGGVQRGIRKEGIEPPIAGKQIYWKKPPSLLPLPGSICVCVFLNIQLVRRGPVCVGVAKD